jgi:hypothetical protein
LRGNAFPATKQVFSGTTTDDKHVQEKAPGSIRAKSDSDSNEIDESDLQSEKQYEQRI